MRGSPERSGHGKGSSYWLLEASSISDKISPNSRQSRVFYFMTGNTY